MLEQYCDSQRELINPTPAFHEVCRSILNQSSVAFVAANAPSALVSSFEAEQQRLARFSLRVASGVLVDQLVHGTRSKWREPNSRFLDRAISKAKTTLFLGACALGRIVLGATYALRHGIPRQLKLLVSNEVLSRIGYLLENGEAQRVRTADGGEFNQNAHLCDEFPLSQINLQLFRVVQDILGALEASLPNDLARLIFLATIRDNNSGRYYHPEVARRFSPELANEAILSCHKRIYETVVALSLEDLTDQLDEYMSTVRAPKSRLIESWTRIRAYRAAIPIDTDPISAEIFFMKVNVAVAILGTRLPTRIQ